MVEPMPVEACHPTALQSLDDSYDPFNGQACLPNRPRYMGESPDNQSNFASFMSLESENPISFQTGGNGTLGTIETTGRIKRKRWTNDEDRVLESLVEQFGLKKWTEMAKYMPGKTRRQLQERWDNQLRPDIKRGPWTDEEEAILIKSHRELGNKWSEIAKKLPGRTQNSVKSHFIAIQRQLQPPKRTRVSSSIELKNYIRSLGSKNPMIVPSQTFKATENKNFHPALDQKQTMLTEVAATRNEWKSINICPNQMPVYLELNEDDNNCIGYQIDAPFKEPNSTDIGLPSASEGNLVNWGFNPKDKGQKVDDSPRKLQYFSDMVVNPEGCTVDDFDLGNENTTFTIEDFDFCGEDANSNNLEPRTVTTNCNFIDLDAEDANSNNLEPSTVTTNCNFIDLDAEDSNCTTLDYSNCAINNLELTHGVNCTLNDLDPIKEDAYFKGCEIEAPMREPESLDSNWAGLEMEGTLWDMESSGEGLFNLQEMELILEHEKQIQSCYPAR